MVKPLTKRNKNGDVYTRPKIVEEEIYKVLALEPAVLEERLKIQNREGPNYVSSECLVYLIRESISTDNQRLIDIVLPRLLSRCEANLRVKVLDDEFRDAESLREDILGDFSEMLASDGTGGNPNELDFYEIRFNQAFRAFRLDRVIAERNRISELTKIPEPSMEDEEENHTVVLERLSRAMRVPAPQESILLLGEILKEINALSADERKAFVLCRIMGYKVESQIPGQVTAATLCKCSGRTIRNRLARVAAKLKIHLEEL